MGINNLMSVQSSPVNPKIRPEYYDTLMGLAYESLAYYKLLPYPHFAFQDWKTEELGPLPRCLPFTKHIINKGAKWLFGKPYLIQAPTSDLTQFVNNMWEMNRMFTKAMSMAKNAAMDGGVVIKYSLHPNSSCPVRFQLLYLKDGTQVFYDPHDIEKMIMLRIQYKYQDLTSGDMMWFREEWTDSNLFIYKPVPAKSVNISAKFAYHYGPEQDWELLEVRENSFKTIPAVHIKNIDTGGAYGVGDLWDLFRIIDRINLSFHLMDKSNQIDTEPTTVFIDALDDEDTLDRPMGPRDVISVKSDVSVGDTNQARVQLLEPQGSMRHHLLTYAKELMRQVYSASGSVDLSVEDVTNKGNLTQAVLSQIYTPLVETTDEKRRSYGEDGICKLMEKVLISCRQHGMPEAAGVNPDVETTYDTRIKWSDYLELTEDEKYTRTVRFATLFKIKMMPKSRFASVVAQTEKFEDEDTFKKELEDKKELPDEDILNTSGTGETKNGKPNDEDKQ